MRVTYRARLAAGLLLAFGASASHANDPPANDVAAASAPAPTATDDDLRQIVRELQERLGKLEAKHAEEWEQDRRRIAELEARVAELQGPSVEEARLKAMQQQVADIRREMAREEGLAPTSQAGGPAGAEDELSQLLAEGAPPAEARPSGVMGTLQRVVQSFNPNIGLTGDFLGLYSRPDGRDPEERLLLRELELGFSGAVDPYTRADVTAAIAREDHAYEADLEEAYLTYTHLPFNLQARVGQMRAEFGRANPFHRHALPWVDYPYVIRRYFGEEGLKGAGAELSWLIPNPWEQYVLLEYELLGNDNDTLFAGEQARDVMHLVRLKHFRELTPTATLELGGSFATAPNDASRGSHRSMVEGIDLTYRWKPKDAGLYRSFLWQTEVLFGQADIRGGQETSWGMYSGAEYQFARRWKFGLRYDHTQLPAESSVSERGYSAYLTFLQSEFAYWRLFYAYTDRDFRDNGLTYEHRFGLQLNWTLGKHPAHKY